MSKKAMLQKNWVVLLKVFLAVIALGVLGEYLLNRVNDQGGDNAVVTKAGFAQCLTDKGVIMYGSDSCEYCQNQKKMFGSSFEKINYVKCDFDKQICEQKGISGYPVWEIGGKLSAGVKTFNQLANATGCVAPK